MAEQGWYQKKGTGPGDADMIAAAAAYNEVMIMVFTK
jgi:hypothetical protein